MWIAYGIQRAFWATGLLEKTLRKIFKTSNIGYGDFVKKVYREFLRGNNGGPAFNDYLKKVDSRFAQYYDPNSEVSNLSIEFPHSIVPMQTSFMLTIFYNFETCRTHLRDWLVKEFDYLTPAEIDKDLDRCISMSNKYTSKFSKFKYVSYNNAVISRFNNGNEQGLIDFMMTQMETYTKSNFLIARTIGI